MKKSFSEFRQWNLIWFPFPINLCNKSNIWRPMVCPSVRCLNLSWRTLHFLQSFVFHFTFCTQIKYLKNIIDSVISGTLKVPSQGFLSTCKQLLPSILTRSLLSFSHRQICFQNPNDNMPRHRIISFYGFTVDNRIVDAETVRKVNVKSI